jgi:hypothetical protein
MKNTILSLIVLLIASSCSITQHTVVAPSNVDLPKEVLVIAQSGTESTVMQTVIDLSNNEMVILSYSRLMLDNVIRTGITVNPDDYRNRKVSSTDAPFHREEEPKPVEPEKK